MRTFFKKFFLSLVLVTLSTIQLSALPVLDRHKIKNHKCEQFKFTLKSFAGAYDIEYHNGGGSRAFTGAIIIDNYGNVSIPYLSGYVFNGSIVESFSYPSPQTGSLTITDPKLGLATLTFPNPIDLSINAVVPIFARECRGKVPNFTGNFVNVDAYILLLNGIRIHDICH